MVPIVGLPILIKNILVVVGGLLLITIILTTNESLVVEVPQAEKSKSPDDGLESEILPTVHVEQVPEFYIEPKVPQKFSRSLLADKPKSDLVPSPLKPKTVRRRTTKATKVKQIEDHVGIV